MPLIDGWNLSQLIQRAALPLDEETIRNWGAQLAELLIYLHQQQPALVLGDIKPEHVMVTRGGLLQLVDFGLTRLFLPEREADFRFAPA
jgi:serine/threonine protein kinase